eukprot:1363829-Rhodomonas_salina.7
MEVGSWRVEHGEREEGRGGEAPYCTSHSTIRYCHALGNGAVERLKGFVEVGVMVRAEKDRGRKFGDCVPRGGIQKKGR